VKGPASSPEPSYMVKLEDDDIMVGRVTLEEGDKPLHSRILFVLGLCLRRKCMSCMPLTSPSAQIRIDIVRVSQSSSFT